MITQGLDGTDRHKALCHSGPDILGKVESGTVLALAKSCAGSEFRELERQLDN